MNRTTFFILFQILAVGFLSATLVFSQTESGSKMILLRASVIDKKGNAVPGLKQEQFKVEDDDVEQKITFFSDREEPFSVSILFDISNSVGQTLREDNAKAILDFVRRSNPQNDYSVIAFNQEVVELTSWGAGEKRIADALNKVVVPKDIDGDTALYDALFYAEEKFRDSKYTSKVTLIFTDGEDTASRYKYQEVRRLAEESDTIIYLVRVGGSGQNLSFVEAMRNDYVNQLADVSGGGAFYPRKTAEMEEVIKRIAAEIKSRYTIGYIPTKSSKNKDRRKVRVKVTANDAKGEKLKLLTRVRTSYFVGKN